MDEENPTDQERAAVSGFGQWPPSMIRQTDIAPPPKRSHKKSRLGCTSCKLRKVKCDEARPACRACRMRRSACEYVPVTPRRLPGSSSSLGMRTSRVLSEQSVIGPERIVKEPLFCLPSTDSVDMKLLWFYTTTTHKSLSYPDDKQRPMDDMLQTVMVQHAFGAPFLMDSILELACWHMQTLGHAPDPTRALIYRARSLEGYRKAIEDANPSTYGPLLANCVLRPMLATQFFQDQSDEELYILDWMLLWRGVQSIINITSLSSINGSGMGPLFARPPMDLGMSAIAVPKELLLMTSFIDHDDPDLAETQTYQDGLRALGSLFDNLRNGIDSIMVLRIVTWGTVPLNRLVDLARAGRPRALVIIAHYAVFLKLLQDIWWLAGVGNRSIKAICQKLGSDWQRFLSIPLSALLVEDSVDLCRVLLGGKNW